MESLANTKESVLLVFPLLGNYPVVELRRLVQDDQGGRIFPKVLLEKALEVLEDEGLVVCDRGERPISYNLTPAGIAKKREVKAARGSRARPPVQALTTKATVLLALLRYGVATPSEEGTGPEELTELATYLSELVRRVSVDSNGVVWTTFSSLRRAIGDPKQGLGKRGMVARLEEAGETGFTVGPGGRRVFYYLTPSGLLEARKVFNGLVAFLASARQPRNELGPSDRGDNKRDTRILTAKATVLLLLLRYDQGIHAYRLRRDAEEWSKGSVWIWRNSFSGAITGGRGLLALGLVRCRKEPPQSGEPEGPKSRRVPYTLTSAGRQEALALRDGLWKFLQIDCTHVASTERSTTAQER